MRHSRADTMLATTLALLLSLAGPGLGCGDHHLVKRQEEGSGRGPEAREVTPGSGIYAYTTGGVYISLFVVTED